MKRARLLILASTMAMVGWGTVLPYQYAYAANTRGWGSFVAAAASSLFSVGALLAAPLGGRLADRFPPVRVAVAAKLVAAAGTGYLVLAGSPAAFLAGMFVFGVGITAAAPAQSVLVLRWVAADGPPPRVRVAVHRPGARHGPGGVRRRLHGQPPLGGRDVAGLHHRGRGLRPVAACCSCWPGAARPPATPCPRPAPRGRPAAARRSG